jgi:hypothetical protein
MKLTKQRLREIIKEELLLEEVEDPVRQWMRQAAAIIHKSALSIDPDWPEAKAMSERMNLMKEELLAMVDWISQQHEAAAKRRRSGAPDERRVDTRSEEQRVDTRSEEQKASDEAMRAYYDQAK